MGMKRRVIIFGLDGATYTVLDDLARRGVMPHLREFMQRGVRGALMSTIPPLTPPAWTTLVTGRSPGAHGIFNFLQFDGNSPYLRIISSREICCETIWSTVSRHGGRAASLNFVAHSPAPKINGYVIPGWVPWRWVKKHSHPAGLIDSLKSEVPGFDLQELAMDFDEEQKAVAGKEIEDCDAWIDIHIRREKQWFGCFRHMLQHGDCDLLGIVFDGVDKLQHLLWQFVDPKLQPVNPSDSFLGTRERCWDYFRLIDGFLGETVELAGEEAMILIASDHGFCGSTEVVYINNWLEQQGWLTWSDRAGVEPAESQSLGEAHPYHITHLDMTRTKAYATSASSNGIHINVAGVRGEHGIHPREYEAFRRELREALLRRCRDPRGNEPLITQVWTRDEAFAGPKSDLAPDLTVALRDGGFFSVLRSDTILKPRPVVMGSHHPEGVLMACGNGVRRGAALPPARLLDIAPTVLYALGLPIPPDLEGAVLDEMFTEEYCQTRRARFEHAPANGRNGQSEEPLELADDEGEAKVIMRLKALGYIE
jgi:predicted AlkP superfamily phosphohydrolase/phosphomutase